MALVDNFDSYTAGDLTGQGTWTDAGSGAGGSIDVQTSVFVSSPNGVASNTTNFAGRNKAFALQANGIQSFRFRVTNTGDNGLMKFRLREGGTNAILVFTNAGNLCYNNGATTPTIQAVSADTWYRVDIQWVLSGSQARYQVDGTGYTAYDNIQNALSAGCDNVTIAQDVGATANIVYWDDLTDTGAGGSTAHNLALLGVGQ